MAVYNDPEFPGQWQLRGGPGVNLLGLYDEYTGRGIRIGLIDTLPLWGSAGLEGQIDWAASTLASGTTPADDADLHGQAVALILAARANDALGGIGAAHGATLVAHGVDTPAYRSVAQETEMLALQGRYDISHNSWSRAGLFFRDDFGDPLYAGAAAAIAGAAATGRHGLGTVFVRSAGNAAAIGDDVNAHSYSNNRHTVLVGATDEAGQVLGLSNPGAALLAVAPGTATSYAAPLASATVALMLEANPRLGYRDVQSILALSARLTDPGGAGWFFNHAADWNGGGLHVSRRAGFGLIDAHAAVRLAESWQEPPLTAATLVTATAARGLSARLDDLGQVAQSVAIAQDLSVERAEVRVVLQHGRIGDLRIALTAPSGTESVLLDRLGNGAYDPASGQLAFTFASTQFLHEASRGAWQLGLRDLAPGEAGRLVSWSLTLAGASASADTRHVFTDEFAALAAADPARRLLRDAAGEDTLNAAAMTGAVWIDLSGATPSLLAGQPLGFAPGTAIEHATGGDGDDGLRGSGAANRLLGGRGDDRIEPGGVPAGGLDRVDGGPGDDLLLLALPAAAYAEARQGGAMLLRGGGEAVRFEHIERIAFADGVVRLGEGPALFDPVFYAARNADVLAAGVSLWAHYAGQGGREGRDPSPLFDGAGYLARNPDVAAAGPDPLTHYLAYGAAEGRAANAVFDTAGYRAANPDVAAAGLNPLEHYALHGWQEGRDPAAGFDLETYRARNPDVAVAGIDPLAHYLQFGRAEGRGTAPAVGAATSDGFDAEYYLLANPDVARAGLAARAHWDAYGAREQRDPNGYFDTSSYLARNPDVRAAGADPLAHYHGFGWREGRDAGPGFDTGAYLAANPDVAAAGLDPLLHFLDFGHAEGRLSYAVLG